MVGATIGIGAVNFIALGWSPAAPLRFVSPDHQCTPGDALARGQVLWTQLGGVAGVGVLGLVLGRALLVGRDLAP
ncbi:hypothetical protein DRB96_01640 [Streptomyces sp. ICC1]|nr:hypothetical protein DRB89_01240 [Streptomyces sp. ICC4]AWZ11250.1 hypothetical protein DRB96_01640 [Streptomyces sp. ICC1]